MPSPSICACALRTADDLQALVRAEALACARFEGRVRPNELTIPAVRSLDGSLIYFVAQDPKGAGPLETDFIFDGGEGTTPIGLEAVDHVAQALPVG